MAAPVPTQHGGGHFQHALTLARQSHYDALIANIHYRIGRVHRHHHAPVEALTQFPPRPRSTPIKPWPTPRWAWPIGRCGCSQSRGAFASADLAHGSAIPPVACRWRLPREHGPQQDIHPDLAAYLPPQFGPPTGCVPSNTRPTRPRQRGGRRAVPADHHLHRGVTGGMCSPTSRVSAPRCCCSCSQPPADRGRRPGRRESG
jgi:hypothetical protein